MSHFKNQRKQLGTRDQKQVQLSKNKKNVQTDGQKHKHTYIQTDRQTDKGTKHRQTCKQTDGTNREKNRQTNRQTERQTNRQTDRQTDRQANKQTDRQTNRNRYVVFMFSEVIEIVLGQKLLLTFKVTLNMTGYCGRKILGQGKNPKFPVSLVSTDDVIFYVRLG